MKNVKSQQPPFLKKAKRHLTFRLIVTYILLLAYFFGIYYCIRHQYLQVDNGGFTTMLFGLMLSQIIIYGIVFMMLLSGSKIFRMLYWVAFVFSTALIYLPASQIINDTSQILSYVVLIACMFIKIRILLQTGLYLHRSPYAQAIFDGIFNLNKKDEWEETQWMLQQKQRQENPKPASLPNMQQQEDNDTPPKLKPALTYQQLAVRLGLCIYISLGVFPILVQVGHSIFTSVDYQSIFANRDMFIACLITAMIWTLPVFYLYYNHPRSKRIVKICIVAEVIRIVVYAPFFIGYMHNTEVEYPLRAYIGFILLDVIRYAALYITIKPIFSIDTPDLESYDDTESEESDNADDLNDAEMDTNENDYNDENEPI